MKAIKRTYPNIYKICMVGLCYGVEKESADLSDEEWSSKFAIQPIPTYPHKLPRKVPIGVRKTGYQPNHSISSLKVIFVLQAPPNSI